MAEASFAAAASPRARGGSEQLIASGLTSSALRTSRFQTLGDAGNWFTLHGYSLHREMALMVEAGLSPWDALVAATTTAGAFLGRSVGLAKGDLGSVVVLEASPLENIANTEKIAHVVHHGVLLDRELLKAQPGDAWQPPRPQLAP